MDGITMRLKQQIQSRKKTDPNQTEAEKWQQIYRMLFLEESAPDPCKAFSSEEYCPFSKPRGS